MNSKAQAGLEYLMTYGWALILIATVIGVLVFIISSPASQATFSSSEPNKIMLKGGAMTDSDTTEILLQNITGGKITITSATSSEYTNITINGDTTPTGLEITAGSQMDLTADLISGTNPTGTITIEYTDYAGLARTAEIRIGGGTSDGTPAPPVQECGNNNQEGTEVCDGSDLAGQSCITQGFTGGTLACNGDCTGFVTTGCGNEGTSFGVTCINYLDDDFDGATDGDDSDCMLLQAGAQPVNWSHLNYGDNENVSSGVFECPVGTNATSICFFIDTEGGYDEFYIKNGVTGGNLSCLEYYNCSLGGEDYILPICYHPSPAVQKIVFNFVSDGSGSPLTDGCYDEDMEIYYCYTGVRVSSVTCA